MYMYVYLIEKLLELPDLGAVDEVGLMVEDGQLSLLVLLPKQHMVLEIWTTITH